MKSSDFFYTDKLSNYIGHGVWVLCGKVRKPIKVKIRFINLNVSKAGISFNYLITENDLKFYFLPACDEQGTSFVCPGVHSTQVSAAETWLWKYSENNFFGADQKAAYSSVKKGLTRLVTRAKHNNY